jgi:DNA-binding ferritin-like protein
MKGQPRKIFRQLNETFDDIMRTESRRFITEDDFKKYSNDRIGTGISSIKPDYSKIIHVLMEMNIQVRVFHWQTRSYAAHQALGGFYDFLSTFTDTFTEKLMGQHGENGLIKMNSVIFEITNLENNNDILKYLSNCERFFIQDIKLILNPNHSENDDLYNMIQELTSEIKKLKYLLKLK